MKDGASSDSVHYTRTILTRKDIHMSRVHKASVAEHCRNNLKAQCGRVFRSYCWVPSHKPWESGLKHNNSTSQAPHVKTVCRTKIVQCSVLWQEDRERITCQYELIIGLCRIHNKCFGRCSCLLWTCPEEGIRCLRCQAGCTNKNGSFFHNSSPKRCKYCCHLWGEKKLMSMLNLKTPLLVQPAATRMLYIIVYFVLISFSFLLRLPGRRTPPLCPSSLKNLVLVSLLRGTASLQTIINLKKSINQWVAI